jgi:hypothetical protein
MTATIEARGGGAGGHGGDAGISGMYQVHNGSGGYGGYAGDYQKIEINLLAGYQVKFTVGKGGFGGIGGSYKGTYNSSNHNAYLKSFGKPGDHGEETTIQIINESGKTIKSFKARGGFAFGALESNGVHSKESEDCPPGNGGSPSADYSVESCVYGGRGGGCSFGTKGAPQTQCDSKSDGPDGAFGEYGGGGAGGAGGSKNGLTSHEGGKGGPGGNGFVRISW